MLVAAVVVVAVPFAVLVVVFVATVVVSFSRYFKLHVLCSGRDRFGPFEMRQSSGSGPGRVWEDPREIF